MWVWQNEIADGYDDHGGIYRDSGESSELCDCWSHKVVAVQVTVVGEVTKQKPMLFFLIELQKDNESEWHHSCD